MHVNILIGERKWHLKYLSYTVKNKVTNSENLGLIILWCENYSFKLLGMHLLFQAETKQSF